MRVYIYMRKDRIDSIDNYKYLGVDFTEHLSWVQLIQSISKSANRAANSQVR